MDPDEVDTAGHERLTGKSRSSGGGGGGNGSWGCRLLRRGCDLARKAAIAGAAATAAPFVAPPLIVLSAAGVALSVPFAAYLASFAATNYLTGALLHSCYPPPQPYHHHQEDDDVEQEFLDAYGQEAPAFSGHLGTQTELGFVEEGEEGDALSLLPRDHGVSEAQVPASADQVGGEFSSVHESGLEPYTSDRGYGTGEHILMDGMEPTRKEMLPGGTGVFASDEDNNLVQKEGEGEFSVLDSGQQSLQFQSEDFGFPDPRVPASGNDDNVVQGKGEGGFSVKNSGQQSFQSDNWNEKEEEEGKATEENKSSHETPLEGFYFPELRALASIDKDDVVQDKGEDEFSAQNLGQYSLLSNTEDEREQDIIMEEKKSTEDIPPRDFVVFESPAPVLHGEDDVVPTNEGFEVPVKKVLEQSSSDSDLVIGEVADVQVEITAIAAPKSEVLPPSNLAAREALVDLVTGEVVDVDVGIAAAAEPQSGVLQQTSESQCDPATGESVVVQVDRVGAAAPRSDMLPLSSLASCESQAVAETAHVGETIGITVMEDTVRGFGDVSKKEGAKTMEENKSESSNETVSQGFYFPESHVPSSVDNDNVVHEKGEHEFSAQNSGQYSLLSNSGDKKEQGITMEEKKSTDDMPPRDRVVSGSSVPVLRAEDNVVQSNKEFEVAVQEVSEGANSDPDLVMGEVTDVQLKVVAIAAPESEVLPPSNLVACESPAGLVTGDVADADVGIAAAAVPESEVLQPTSESQRDPSTRESVDVQVDSVGAAAPGSEVLPLSSLAAWESQAVAETAHVGETIGITVMEDTVRDFGDVSRKEGAKTMEENKPESTKETVSRGSYFPESRVLSSVDDDNVVHEKKEGEFSAQNSGQYSLQSNTGDKKEKGVRMEENKSIEDMLQRDSVISASSVPVLRDEDNVVQSKEGFEVAVQEVMEEANSTTDLVMGSVADGQVEIIAIAAPETESEVLPPSNVVARELPSDLAAAALGSEVLHPSNLATSESPADPVTEEIVVVQVDIVAAAAPGSEVLPLSSLADFESEAVAETAHVGEVTRITVMEDIVRDFGDVSTEGVRFVSVESVHDDEDAMSSGTTPYFSTMEEEEPNQSTGVGYAMMNEAFGSRTLAGGEAHYTEEQLREQLDTIRTITGYGAMPSPTLEGELAGLYIFVGVEVEPAVGSVDTSDRLMELSAKLRFLKSIIGVD